MDGSNLDAGAVAFVQQVRNPIRLARAIMEQSEHVFLCGAGALEYAQLMNLPLEPKEYFFTADRYEQWQTARLQDRVQLDHSDPELPDLIERKFGTTGAVALDTHGNLAAATSTGGLTNKRYGRIGDSALIGCGNYANNEFVRRFLHGLRRVLHPWGSGLRCGLPDGVQRLVAGRSGSGGDLRKTT